MARITVDPVFGALRDAGLADDHTTRVVIDIKAGSLPVVHIERLGDERLVQVVDALDGAEIEISYQEKE